MALRNTQSSYGSVAKFFHWTISGLVMGMLIFGASLGVIDSGSAYGIHKSIGLTVLALVVFRLTWRITNPTPSLPSHIPGWQRVGAHAAHLLLYVAILGMPLSGWIMSVAEGRTPKYFGLFAAGLPLAKNKALATIASNTHLILAWTLTTLLLMHVLVALKHHLIDKDEILKRMLPKRK